MGINMQSIMVVDKESSVSMWVCLPLAVVLVLVRLGLRVFRRKKFSQGDFWCLAAGLFTLGRLIANDYLLHYGSTRVLKPAAREKLLDPAYKDEYDKVVLGSKLVLVTRTLLISSLWSCKMAVSDLIARLIISQPWENKVMRFIWASLAVTFLSALIPIFAECHPFPKHWQINPEPGKCVIGNVWIVTYEVTNIITDTILMAIPLTVIFCLDISLMQRLRLLFLFTIGFFLIAISILRIKQGLNSWLQPPQTVWSSLELFLAVVVAVTPTIYGLIRNGGSGDTMLNGSANTENTNISNETSKIYPEATVQPIDFETYKPRGWKDLNETESPTDNSSRGGRILARHSSWLSGMISEKRASGQSHSPV